MNGINLVDHGDHVWMLTQINFCYNTGLIKTINACNTTHAVTDESLARA